MYNGSVVVTVVVDGSGGLAADPILSTTGLLEPDDAETREVVFEAIRKALKGISKSSLKDLGGVQETLRIAVRRAFRNHLDKKPVTSIHLVRI
jgi:ribonuclease J